MLLAAAFNSIIQVIAIFGILALVIGLFMRRVKQPYIIGYILVGVLLGESGLGLVSNSESIHYMGELGIILLLFFIGMEISLPDFVRKWRVAIIGTALQVGFSVLLTFGVGLYFDWPTARSVVMGFVIALSSSAVVIKLLQDRGIIQTTIGTNVLSILLTQDIIIVPLLILTSFMGGVSKPTSEIILMIVGGVLLVVALLIFYKKKKISLPFGPIIEKDHELQVFVAILFCFGGALFTSLFGLSPALGAFFGGLVLDCGKTTAWIHDTLNSFRIFFVAVFFVSIGLQMDLGFLQENIGPIVLVLLAVYLSNHILNSLIMKLFACSWREAFTGGAYLAQVGELSFLISSTAYAAGILQEYGYQFTITLISLTLIVSPFWINATERLLHMPGGRVDAKWLRRLTLAKGQD